MQRVAGQNSTHVASSMFRNIIDVFRPIRWYRNLTMLFGAVIAIRILRLKYAELLTGHRMITVALALTATCLVASGNYGVNEVLDAEYDIHHPEKQHRAIPSGRISASLVIALSVILYIAGLAMVAVLHNWLLLTGLVLFLLSGLAYNVSPVRLKDKPYLDFTSEALNNPIRLMIGWYAVATSAQIVPLSMLLGYWFLGVFLMAAKRFGELRLLGDREKARAYRASLGYYDEEKLLMAMIGAATAFSFMLGVLSFKYSVDAILVLPFVIAWIVWFFAMAFESNTVVNSPERIFEKPGFTAFTIALLIGFTFLFYTGDKILGWVK